MSAHPLDPYDSNCRETVSILLISNRWFKTILLLHIFVSLTPLLSAMVHDAFLTYLLVAAVLPRRVESLVVLKKCTSGYMHQEN